MLKNANLNSRTKIPVHYRAYPRDIILVTCFRTCVLSLPYSASHKWGCKHILFYDICRNLGRSQRPRCLRRGSEAVRLLGLWFRIPPGAWMSVCCECRVLSDRGLCVGLITRPEESYRVPCVWVWNLENEEALAHYYYYCRDMKKKFYFRWTHMNVTYSMLTTHTLFNQK
jgi:hypothetical protein